MRHLDILQMAHIQVPALGMAMKHVVFNCTRQTLLASDLEIAEAAWKRMKGLLGRGLQDFAPGKGLWISPSQGIHTIGMSFPIDVVYLDSRFRVLQVYHRLKPFRIARIRLRSRSVLELPSGTLAETRTEVGDLLQIFISRRPPPDAVRMGNSVRNERSHSAAQ